MQTEQTNIEEPSTTTLSEIVEPLAQALQTLTEHPRDEIHVVPFTFQGQEVRHHEAYLELDMHAETPERLLRALWTILECSESWSAWLNCAGPDPQNAFSGPIAFALVQQHYGIGDFEKHSYLWAYCQREPLDIESAERQIASLVDLIGDSNNLLELTSQHRMQL